MTREDVENELRLRETRDNAEKLRAEFGKPGGLIKFIRHFWHVLEPGTQFKDGWALEAICIHLEAITFGLSTRTLMNVPPGFMKSLTSNVFWPAWEWGAMNMPHLRYVCFSYSAGLTERDNSKFRDLIQSGVYQELYRDRFKLRKTGEGRVTNDHHGSKLATSTGGTGTGERGDRVILDDPHNVKNESDDVRAGIVLWFREAMNNRTNDAVKSAILIIMQRVHQSDVSGWVLDPANGQNYDHLMIPMEFDPGRHCITRLGWRDPREHDGELAWPARFPQFTVEREKRTVGTFAWAGQYQQSPVPRGGGIILRASWRVWDQPKFPPFEFVLASLDTAYTEKQDNDPSALTVWGFWHDKTGAPCVVLIWAWRKWLQLHGDKRDLEREPGEVETAYQRRTQPKWGLCEWVTWSCRRFKADLLLIEAKAAGISVAQEIRKELFATETWGVQLVDPKRLDKVARTHAVQPIWANGMVYAPVDANGNEMPYAELVMDEMEAFPKGVYDDLHDTATQALKHLRDIGLLAFADEAAAELEQNLRFKPKPKPLYQV